MANVDYMSMLDLQHNLYELMLWNIENISIQRLYEARYRYIHIDLSSCSTSRSYVIISEKYFIMQGQLKLSINVRIR